MKKIFNKTALLLVVSFVPGVAFAVDTPGNFTELILIFVDLIIATLPIVAGLSLLAFFWGMAKFILNAGSESGREEGKQVMKWGIIALFVAVSIFGILTFLYNEFGFSNSVNIGIPELPTNL